MFRLRLLASLTKSARGLVLITACLIGIAVAFALLARTLRRGSWRVAILAGVAGGALIFVCYAAAFLVTDRRIS